MPSVLVLIHCSFFVEGRRGTYIVLEEGLIKKKVFEPQDGGGGALIKVEGGAN